MFKVIAKITVNQNDNKGNMFRKTPPRDGFGQSTRKTPPRELLHQQSVPSKDESNKDDDNNLQEITDKLQETVVDAKKKLKEKSKKAIANISKVILVNMGMVIAIFCYTTMGALVFQSKLNYSIFFFCLVRLLYFSSNEVKIRTGYYL